MKMHTIDHSGAEIGIYLDDSVNAMAADALALTSLGHQ